jgi:hypothetical protein
MGAKRPAILTADEFAAARVDRRAHRVALKSLAPFDFPSQ